MGFSIKERVEILEHNLKRLEKEVHENEIRRIVGTEIKDEWGIIHLLDKARTIGYFDKGVKIVDPTNSNTYIHTPSEPSDYYIDYPNSMVALFIPVVRVDKDGYMCERASLPIFYKYKWAEIIKE